MRIPNSKPRLYEALIINFKGINNSGILEWRACFWEFVYFRNMWRAVENLWVSERLVWCTQSLYLPLWDYILVWGSKMTLSNCQKYLAVTVWLLPDLWSLCMACRLSFLSVLVFISEDPICVVYQLCLCCAPGCMPRLPWLCVGTRLEGKTIFLAQLWLPWEVNPGMQVGRVPWWALARYPA